MPRVILPGGGTGGAASAETVTGDVPAVPVSVSARAPGLASASSTSIVVALTAAVAALFLTGINMPLHFILLPFPAERECHFAYTYPLPVSRAGQHLRHPSVRQGEGVFLPVM